MARKAQAVPIYKRAGGWYADLRRYRDVGGKRLALRPPGAREPVRERKLAVQLCQELIAEYEAARRERRQVGGPALGQCIGPFLTWKAEHTTVTERTLADDERHLLEARAFFEAGGLVAVGSIRPHDVERWLTHLRRTLPARDGKRGVRGTTLRNRLHSLSSLFRWVVYREFAPLNPVSALIGSAKPGTEMQEAQFLQADTVALLLEAARLVPGVHPYQYALVSTLVLTGGRKAEVLGLEVRDVDFDRGTITFRPNQWRRLKTKRSARVVTLWPQLRAILEEWFATCPPSALLFPLWRGAEERMLTDLRPMWQRLESGIGWEPRHPLDPSRLGAKPLRNAYAAQRLQTLDRGQPVAVYTVARELGHSSTDMLERVYAHLGTVRHRSEVVEFRVEDFPSIAERVAALRARFGVRVEGPR